VRQAAGMVMPGWKHAPKAEEMAAAARDLADLGIRVYPQDREKPGWLAVSNTHEGTAKLFDGTHWAKGGWSRSLGRLPGAYATKGSVRFGNAPPTRAVMIPLDALGLFSGSKDQEAM
jgi:hypothetical protein